jgi:hypothetical protein
MLRHAFKEWAVICKALGEGRQALILRKGGIAEDGGRFRVEHALWLYPTHVHQQRDGIRPEAAPLLEASERERPPTGTVRLTHFAEVAGIYHVRDIASALILGRLHLWSPQTVQLRFAYRSPGLYVLPVRVYRAREVFDLTETSTYAGCKELGRAGSRTARRRRTGAGRGGVPWRPWHPRRPVEADGLA